MRSAFVNLLVIGLLAIASSFCSFGAGAAETPPLTIDGMAFEIHDLGNDANAFGNRQYVWKEVPGQFDGWQFTQTLGGDRGRMEFTPGQDCVVYAATSTNGDPLPEPEWQRVAGTKFHYTSAGYTEMAVFTRACKADERVIVPQINWTGTILLAPALARGEELEIVRTLPPGVIIDTSPDPMKVYIGSPSIAVLPNGDYVASHDLFGRGTTMSKSVVLGSKDRGATWEKLCDLQGQWWSTLFVHRGALYVIGANKRYGDTVIRRSTDGGKTWTEPKDGKSGLLLTDEEFHCAPMPVVEHNGRLWRAMEDAGGPGGWGPHFRAFVMSVPVDADLLDAANWTFSNRLQFDPAWLPFEAERPGWLEGNVVVTPEGKLINMLRFNEDRGDRAAIVDVSDDGTTVAFDPDTGFIDFPGGRTKFTIRFDPTTKRYWSLVNKQTNPEAFRNILALVSSADLRDWQVESIILEHPDKGNHAFQYVDWLFDGDDLIAVSRTAWDGSHNAHDANYMTFHRIEGFRDLGAKEASGK